MAKTNGARMKGATGGEQKVGMAKTSTKSGGPGIKAEPRAKAQRAKNGGQRIEKSRAGNFETALTDGPGPNDRNTGRATWRQLETHGLEDEARSGHAVRVRGKNGKNGPSRELRGNGQARAAQPGRGRSSMRAGETNGSGRNGRAKGAKSMAADGARSNGRPRTEQGSSSSSAVARGRTSKPTAARRGAMAAGAKRGAVRAGGRGGATPAPRRGA